MKPKYEPDLLDPGEEGAPMGSRRELVNLTRRALEAERLLSERTQELAKVWQLFFSAQGHLADCFLKEGELLTLADELEKDLSDAGPWPTIGQILGPASIAAKIRSILRLPE